MKTKNYNIKMSDQEKNFINEFKKQIIRSLVIYAFAILAALIGMTLKSHYGAVTIQKDHDTLKTQTEAETRVIINRLDRYDSRLIELHDRKIEKSDYVREIDEMKQMLRDINRKLDRR